MRKVHLWPLVVLLFSTICFLSVQSQVSAAVTSAPGGVISNQSPLNDWKTAFGGDSAVEVTGDQNSVSVKVIADISGFQSPITFKTSGDIPVEFDLNGHTIDLGDKSMKADFGGKIHIVNSSYREGVIRGCGSEILGFATSESSKNQIILDGGTIERYGVFQDGEHTKKDEIQRSAIKVETSSGAAPEFIMKSGEIRSDARWDSSGWGPIVSIADSNTLASTVIEGGTVVGPISLDGDTKHIKGGCFVSPGIDGFADSELLDNSSCLVSGVSDKAKVSTGEGTYWVGNSVDENPSRVSSGQDLWVVKKGTITDFAVLSGVKVHNISGSSITVGGANVQNSADGSLPYTVSALNETEFNRALEDARKKVSESYTASTWEAFASARTSAEALAENPNRTQKELNSAKNELSAKSTGLKERANFDNLSAAIARANQIDKAYYTSTSYKKVADEIAAAQKVLDNATEADTAAVNAEVQKLETAISGLVMRSNLIALQEKTDEARQFRKDNEEEMSFENAAALRQAIASAEKLLVSGDTTDTQADEAIQALDNATQDSVKNTRHHLTYADFKSSPTKSFWSSEPKESSKRLGKGTGAPADYRTEADIIEYIDSTQTMKNYDVRTDLMNSEYYTTYSTEPDLSNKTYHDGAYYNEGVVSENTQQMLVDTVNIYRYIAGKNKFVSYYPQFAPKAQAFSFVQAVRGISGHEVGDSAPDGVLQSTWDLAKEVVKKCSTARDLVSAPGYVAGWIRDSQNGSLESNLLGHRLYIFNELVEKTAFGDVQKGGYHWPVWVYADAENVISPDDKSGSPNKQYIQGFYTWPAQNMPVEFSDSGMPWSITSPALAKGQPPRDLIVPTMFYSDDLASHPVVVSIESLDRNGSSTSIANSLSIVPQRSTDGCYILNAVIYPSTLKGFEYTKDSLFKVSVSYLAETSVNQNLEYEVHYFEMDETKSKEELQQAINEAKSAFERTIISDTGEGVIVGWKYASTSAANTLNAAISAAETAAAQSKTDYKTDFDSLASALSAFESEAQYKYQASADGLRQAITDFSSLVSCPDATQGLDNFVEGQIVCMNTDAKSAYSTEAGTVQSQLGSLSDATTTTREFNEKVLAFKASLYTVQASREKEALSALVERCQTDFGDVVSSTDGQNLPHGQRYLPTASQSVKSTFDEALANATNELQSLSATKQSLTEKLQALEQAYNNYYGAIATVDVRYGLSSLKEANDKLEKLIFETYESKDGTGVAEKKYWATKEALFAAKSVVMEANAINSSDAISSSDIAKALEDLSAATQALTQARKQVPVPEVAPYNLDTLNALLKECEALTKTQVCSDDEAFKKTSGEKYLPSNLSTVKDNLDAKITAGNKVVKEQSGTSAAIKQAIDDLRSAKASFESSCKTVVNLTTLKDLIDACNGRKTEIVKPVDSLTSLADATLYLPDNDKAVTAFTTAITAADGVYKDQSQEGEGKPDRSKVEKAVLDLQTAQKTFESAIKTYVVDINALTTKINEFNELIASTATSSVEGADIQEDAYWATSDNINTARQAISAAVGVITKGGYTGAQISGALTTLSGAYDAFNGQRQAGKHSKVETAEDGDWQALNKAIEAAKAKLQNINKASSLAEAKKQLWYKQDATWYLQSDVEALNKAISDAEAVYERHSEPSVLKSVVTSATAALNAKSSEFDGKKQTVQGVASETDWSDLESAIDAAQREFNKVGNDVGKEIHEALDEATAAQNDWYVNNTKWVTNAEKEALKTAIDTANGVYSKKESGALDASEVQAAKSAIDEALGTFKAAIKTLSGLATSDEYDALQQAITSAEEKIKDVKSATDLEEAKGQDWYKEGSKWAETEKLNALNEQISAAKELMKKKDDGSIDRTVKASDVTSLTSQLTQAAEAVTVHDWVDPHTVSPEKQSLLAAISEAKKDLQGTLQAGKAAFGDEGKDIVSKEVYDTFKGAIDTAEAASKSEDGFEEATRVLNEAKGVFDSAKQKVTDPNFYIVTGSALGSTYVQPTTEPQQIWMAIVPNASGDATISNPFGSMVSNMSNILSFPEKLNAKAKKVTYEGSDTPTRVKVTELYSQEGTDITGKLSAGRYGQGTVNYSIADSMQCTSSSKEIIFITVDAKLAENVASGTSVVVNMSAQTDYTTSRRGINLFYVGRPVWETTVKASDASPTTIQGGDTTSIDVETTQTAPLIPVTDGQLEIVIPEGLTPVDTETQSASYDVKDIEGNDAAEGKGTIQLTWNGAEHKFTYSDLGQLSKSFYKGSKISGTIQVKAEAGVVGTKTISASAHSEKTDNTPVDSLDIVVAKPSGQISVDIDRTHAQAGDKVTYTVHVSELSGTLPLKNVVVTPDWQYDKLTGQTGASSAETIEAGGTKDYTFEATVAEGALTSESFAAQFKLNADNIDEISVSANTVDIVVPSLQLERAFVPAIGKGDDAEVTVRLSVGNETMYSSAKNVVITDTLPQEMSATGGVTVTLADGSPTEISGSLTGESHGATVTFPEIAGGTTYMVEYKASVSGIEEGNSVQGTLGATSNNVSEIASVSSSYKVAKVEVAVEDSNIQTLEATGSVDLSNIGELASDTYVQAGEKIKFSGVLKSKGDELPTQVTISGTLPAAIDASEIKVGNEVLGLSGSWTKSVESWSEDIPYEITGVVKDGYSGQTATNKVEVKIGEDVATTYEQSVSVVAPELSLERSLASEKARVQAGDTVTYKTVVKETAENAYATNVKLSDVLPTGLTGSEESVQFSGVNGEKDINGNTGVFTFKLLKPNDTSTLTYNATIDAGTPAGQLKNTCTVTADYLSYSATDVVVEVIHPTAAIVYDQNNPATMSAADGAKDFKIWVLQNTEDATLKNANITINVRDGLKINQASANSGRRDEASPMAIAAAPQVHIEGQKVTLDSCDITYDAPVCITLNLSVNGDASGTAPITTSVSADGPVEATSQESQGEVTILVPGLNIAKKVSKTDVQPGDQVVFDVLVEQIPDGEAKVKNVEVTDNLPEGLTLGSVDVYGFADLEDFENPEEITGDDLVAGSAVVTKNDNGWTLNIDELGADVEGHVVFTATVGKVGKIENIISATAEGIDGKTASAKVNSQNPSLEIEKSVNLPTIEGRPHSDGDKVYVGAGEKFTYEIKLGNHQGSETAGRPVRNITVDDTMPEGVKLDASSQPYITDDSSSDANGSVSIVDGVVKATVPEFSIGKHLTIHIPVIAETSFFGNKEAQNTATYSATNIVGGNVKASVKSYDAGLSVVKSVDRSIVNEGDAVNYTITVSQTTAATSAVGVVITDTIPEGLSVDEASINISGNASKTFVGNALTVNAESIGESSPVIITYKATVSKDLQPSETLTNNVSVHAENVASDASGSASIGQCQHQWMQSENDLLADENGWMKDVEATCHSDGHKYRKCSICGAVENQTITNRPAHTLERVRVGHQDAKCDDGNGQKVKGFDKYQQKCTVDGCGYTKNEIETVEIEAPDCQWIDGEPVYTDCTSNGTVTSTCPGLVRTTKDGEPTVSDAVAQHTTQKSVSPQGHDFQEAAEVVDDQHPRVEPTCQSQGSHYLAKSCSRCGAYESEPTQESIAQLDHKWVVDATTDSEGWKVIESAKCEVQGKKERTCEGVGTDSHTETGVVSALEHDSDGIPTVIDDTDGAYAKKEPTCTEQGYHYEQKTCSKCGKPQGDPVKVMDAELGHQFNDQNICDRCKKSKSELCEHQWSQWQVKKPASCTEKGEQTRSCPLCGKEQSETLDIIGHTYTQGKVETKVIKEATCTEEGSHTETPICDMCGKANGETKTVIDHKLAHDYVDGVCKDCGAVLPKLEELHQKVDTLIAEVEALDGTLYTPDSWNNVSAALANAKACAENPKATISDYEVVVNGLIAAIDALELNTANDPAIALEKLVAQGSALQENNYTPETWKAFADALSAAQAVLADESATPEAIEAAMQALDAATKALEPAESSGTVTPGEDDNPSEGDNPSGGNSPSGGDNPSEGDKPNEGDTPDEGNNPSGGSSDSDQQEQTPNGNNGSGNASAGGSNSGGNTQQVPNSNSGNGGSTQQTPNTSGNTSQNQTANTQTTVSPKITSKMADTGVIAVGTGLFAAGAIAALVFTIKRKH